MSCYGGSIILPITRGKVSSVVAVLLTSPLLRGKGHVDLFLGKFSFCASQTPDLECHGTLRVLTVSNRKTDLRS